MRSAWEAAGLNSAEAQQALCEAFELLAPQGSVSQELKSPTKMDRAAVLNLMVFDQLPDYYASYGELLMLQDSAGARNEEDKLLVDPSIVEKMTVGEKEAARFAMRLGDLSSEEARTRSRLKRLREEPLMREVSVLVAADAELAELAKALAPWEPQLYGAARRAQLRARPEEDRPQGTEIIKLNLELTIFQVIGSLVVTAALAFFSAQAVKQAIFPDKGLSAQAGDMPLYSLKSDASRPFNGDRSARIDDLPIPIRMMLTFDLWRTLASGPWVGKQDIYRAAEVLSVA